MQKTEISLKNARVYLKLWRELPSPPVSLQHELDWFANLRCVFSSLSVKSCPVVSNPSTATDGVLPCPSRLCRHRHARSARLFY